MYIVRIKDNINKDIIDWKWLSNQPHLIDIIEQHLEDYVDWFSLASNPGAAHIIERNLDKIEFSLLASNPNAISIIEKKLDKYNFNIDDEDKDFWDNLSANPNAYSILKDNICNINWEILASNPNVIFIFTNLMIEKNKLIYNYLNNLDYNDTIDISFINKLFNFDEDNFIDKLSSNPNAILLIEKNLDKINRYDLVANLNACHLIKKMDIIYWCNLSPNPNAINLIENKINDESTNPNPYKKIKFDPFDPFLFGNKHLESLYPWDCIDWDKLSYNIKAVHILKKNLNKVNWNNLSLNSNAIDLLKKNLDKINWHNLSLNPNAIAIFDNYNFENLNRESLIKYLIKINYVIKVDGVYKASFDDHFLYLMEDFYRYPQIKIPRLKGHFLNNIFEVNYKFLKDRMDSTIGEELMQVMFHPKNINKFQDWGF
jgi:hypothetical protein